MQFIRTSESAFGCWLKTYYLALSNPPEEYSSATKM